MFLVDKAYSSREIREHPRGRGIRAVIPERADQRANRIRPGGRWQTAAVYLAGLHVACVVLRSARR